MQAQHIKYLDGLRGGLSLWVFIGHVAIAVGLYAPPISSPAYAVDIFMVLSGFVMVHAARLDREPLFGAAARAFWVARYMRIAPVYFALLLICLPLLGVLAEMKDAARAAMPPPWTQPTGAETYVTQWSFGSYEWVISHVTFVFGLVPSQVQSTPLPDWSLSLEMQFYAAFPLLLILVRRVHPMVLASLAAAMCIGSTATFGNYGTPGLLAHYTQPAMLSFRLNAFLAGMFLAMAARDASGRRMLVAAAIVAMLPLYKTAPVFLLFLFLTVGRLAPLRFILQSRPAVFIGEISYSIYLAHMLLVIPACYWASKSAGFLALHPAWRFLVVVTVVLPLLYAISVVLHRLVERPGIALGRALATRIRAARPPTIVSTTR